MTALEKRVYYLQKYFKFLFFYSKTIDKNKINPKNKVNREQEKNVNLYGVYIYE